MSVSLGILEEACTRLVHTTRAMFGGHGLFAPNGGMFAGVVDEDRIVFKLADDAARAELEAIGGRAWTYAGKMTMREWILAPDAFYDDQELMETWARRAHALAPPKARKTPKKKAVPEEIADSAGPAREEKVTSKKLAATKPAVKKPAAKKAAVKKAAAKKATAKKAAAKKATAKKAAGKRRPA